MFMDGTSDKDSGEERKDVGLEDGYEQFEEADADLTKKAADGDDCPESGVTLGGGGDERKDHAECRVAAHDIAKQSHRKDEVLNEKAESFDDEHQPADADGTDPGHAGIGNEVAEEATEAERFHAVSCGGDEGAERECSGDVDVTGGRSERRDGAEQIAEEDVKETAPDEGQVLIRRMPCWCSVSMMVGVP